MTRRFITLSAVALAAGACHFGGRAEERDPGATVSRNYQVGAFDKIEVAGPYEVKVTTGGSPARAPPAATNCSTRPKSWSTGRRSTSGPRSTRACGSAGASAARPNSPSPPRCCAAPTSPGRAGSASTRSSGDFKGAVAGSGDLRLAAVKGGKVEFSIAGSGGITAAGHRQLDQVGIAGSGDIDAGALAAKTADVSIAGSGNVRANASDTRQGRHHGIGRRQHHRRRQVQGEQGRIGQRHLRLAIGG